MAEVGTGLLQIPKRSMGRTQASRGSLESPVPLLGVLVAIWEAW